MLVYATNDTFKDEVSSGVSVVDFYADWCGPCKMIAPILEQISDERDDVKIVKLNVDENREVSMEYGIRNIPTLLIMKDGKEVKRQVGFVPKPVMIKMIEENL